MTSPADPGPAPSSATATGGPVLCPGCSAPAAGHFCSTCGAPLEGAICASCRTALTPGAKFCHRCGSAATGGSGAPWAAGPFVPQPDRGLAGVLPWAVAAIALAALIALVAGQRIGGRTAQSVDAPQNALPQTGLDDRGLTTPASRAPDLSTMTPREQADRLFDRIMRLESEGKLDSAQFFAQMAMAVYQQIPERDADVRYDLGRIAVVGGVPRLGAAEADSILAQNPHHLLGLILGATAARAASDEARARRYDQRFLADALAERARKLPEYQRHQADIDSTLAQLGRRTRN